MNASGWQTPGGDRSDPLPPQRGDLSDGLIFDAVRIRLLEIGEAVKALPEELLATQPSIPWPQIASMRDHLAHRYFDTAHAILQATVDEDLPDLERAVRALADSLPEERPGHRFWRVMTRHTRSPGRDESRQQPHVPGHRSCSAEHASAAPYAPSRRVTQSWSAGLFL